MKPEEVFRFVNVRPVQQAPISRVIKGFAAYDKDAKSPFHKDVAALKGPDAREKAVELARKRLAASIPDDKQLGTLLAAVRAAAGKDKVGDSKEAAEKELKQSIDTYLKNEETRQLRDSLWDRLYAHTLVPEERPEERESIYEGVRAFHFLELLGKQKDKEKPLTGVELSTVTPTIPKGLIPGAIIGDKSLEDRHAIKVVKELDTVYNKLLSLNSAIKDLKDGNRAYNAQEMRTVVDFSAKGTPQTEMLRGVRLTRSVLEFPERIAGKATAKPKTPSLASTAMPLEQTIIMVPKKAPWIFEEFGQKRLNKATLDLLYTRKTKLVELEVAEAVAALEQEKHELVTGFIKKLPDIFLQHVRNTDQFMFLLEEVAIPGYQIAPVMLATPLPVAGSAAARGIQPLGIGDLLVVKQELMRYAAGEVAHIENVLKSESKTRMHSRTREVEEIIITETERLEESEKDLQTTERFELHKEAQKTIESQMSLDAGVSITASYGPVSVTAHADFALSQSSSESSKTASTYAKQVTERSVSRIMQRTREERTRRTLERFEEKNEHGIDNKDGEGHVIGVYRWVDKYYKARLINYGRRLMMEFIVPEPAAFYLYLQSKQTLQGVTMARPEEPKVSGRRLSPTDLNKNNYMAFVAQYNVQEVKPYPDESVDVSVAFADKTESAGPVPIAKAYDKLFVPAGYKCSNVWGAYYVWSFNGDFKVFCAGREFGSFGAPELEGIIPISVIGANIVSFQVNIVAFCQVKPETITAWQLETYGAIMNAYERALADYNEQVAAAQIQGGVQIEGRNPELNRKIERDELKKGALRLLTDNFAQTRVSGAWRFNEMFNAMQANGQFGYPEFNTNEAIVEGRMIQFFEQALEWNNMTYRFYPYSWGRKSGWKDIFPLTDTDPQFTDFVRAGAARVIVPAHPAYTDTVLHFMATNEIWNGGNPPTLYDPLYISIVDELKSDAGGDIDANLPACAPDSEYPCLADEWEVKLPTTLVYLQEDAQLPDYTP
ncbi:MAG: hypothetical protein WA277_11835 [Nitrospirota bacterium]